MVKFGRFFYNSFFIVIFALYSLSNLYFCCSCSVRRSKDSDVFHVCVTQAGDPDSTGAITFLSLIQLLSKHHLYISESGHIARYGKTKGTISTSRNRRSPLLDRVQNFMFSNISALVWFMLYLALNLVLFVAGVGHYSSVKDVGSWTMWAYSTGPVLSMNTVLLLLPTLSSLIHAMRGSHWMNMVSA